MTMRISKRLGASVGALLAVMGAAPAMADDTADLGPVKVTLGGFLASEGLYRSRDEGADIGSTFSGVPFSNTSTAHTSELRFTARQSRVTMLVQGDVSSDLHLAMYGEMDFLGGAQTANSNESNSFNLRIRNIYTTADWDSMGLEILAGQSWSLVTLNSHGITPRNEVPPATIEAQYAVGFNWARQPQIRITKNWNKEFWLAVSVENPQTTFAPNAAAAAGVTVTDLAAGGSEFDKANNFSLNHIPDFIGKVAWEPMIDGAQPLHIEVLGIYRSFYDRINVAATNGLNLPANISNANISGGGFGGSITWQAIPKLLDLQITGMNGQGIGRYGSGQLAGCDHPPGRRACAHPGNHRPVRRDLACHADARHLWLCRPGSGAAEIFQHRHGAPPISAWAIPATIWRAAQPKAALARPISRRKIKPMSASGGKSIRAISAASALGCSIPTPIWIRLRAPAACMRPPMTAWCSPASAIIPRSDTYQARKSLAAAAPAAATLFSAPSSQ